MERVIDIRDIPINEIYLFISQNGIALLDIENEDQAYKLAEELIINGVADFASDSIVNWIHAYNSSKQYDLDHVNLTDIIQAQDHDLIELSDQLGLEEINKNDMIEILDYMGKLNNDIATFDILPKDTLIDIMSNLDYESIKLMSESSNKLRSIYESKQFAPILQQKYDDYIRLTSKYSGKIDPHGVFRILDKDIEIGDSPSNISRGRSCDTHDRHRLINIMWEIEVPLPVNYILEFDKINENNRIDAINSLLDAPQHRRIRNHTYDEMMRWSLKRLNYYFILYNIKGFKMDSICTLIQNRMNQLGLL